MLSIGMDVGSTTVKIVVLDAQGKVLHQHYTRHQSQVFETAQRLLAEVQALDAHDVRLVVTGSGGLALAEQLGVRFEQEVIACAEAVKHYIPQTDVAIELGGEDAKITFYGANVEQRMNGTCAGGTGAFIDQMAVLLDTDAQGLNEAAKEATILYPIAARCGVFAKTDIQPLINQGAAKSDLALSIFQAVVEQTISGLACGRKIGGNVAFLGGPLTFLSELRQRFIDTLKLTPEQVIFPKDAAYYPALGAALVAAGETPQPLDVLMTRMKTPRLADQMKTMPPLFASDADYEDFVKRHAQDKVEQRPLEAACGAVFVGIDAGSTTTKLALCDSEGCLLATNYAGNAGDPVATARRMLGEVYAALPEKAYIARAVTTGYGEDLVKAAFAADAGEIETVAHYEAAKAFLPEVDVILDIGGQDMKCIRIADGAVSSITLNEACSSGCGSFLETYAKSIGLDIGDFAERAVHAKHPVDLGTRCTVFMNSKVKQVQKEGASVDDIAAGLAYSVVRNALYKVLKVRDPESLGNHIVVQGGTFLNDGVLAAFEQLLGRSVVRPDIAGVMGAYGAALIARRQWLEEGAKGRSTLLDARSLAAFTMTTSQQRCGGCQNNCPLTINQFPNGTRFISGNRCERGAGGSVKASDEMNLFAYKQHRLFDYEPLAEADAPRGTIGIPRVLNMYENYPFWHTFFSQLGFRVVLSPPSSKKLYSRGIDTLSSDSLCYPAKFAHGHVRWLAEQGIATIFYPCITYEMEEDASADNHFNCPIVGMYPETIAGNMDEVLAAHGSTLLHPFLPYFDDKRLAERMAEVLAPWHVTKHELMQAIEVARAEDARCKRDVQERADAILQRMEKEGGHGIVLAGRPYHLDPEINHGIDRIIASFGFAVLTESSVAEHGTLDRPLGVLDQWMYHHRLYRAAAFCATRDDLDLVQLNSFGCGLDAVTTDEVETILRNHGKLYTVLKIDEGVNLGAVRIRLRSLQAAIRERKAQGHGHHEAPPALPRAVFTADMKQDYTLLMPQMAPMQFDLLSVAFQSAGYRTELLPKVDRQAIETGLKYINNDACYPTIVALGQVLQALLSGRYDLDHTAVLMAQTGGGCRASNYVALLRKALVQLNMAQVPIVSINANSRMEQNPGMRFGIGFAYSLLYAILYGDLFMRLSNAVRPYEQEPGSTQRLYEHWNAIARENVRDRDLATFKRNIQAIVRDFDRLPLHTQRKPKIGVVGEILVKYHPDANNDIVGTIEREGGEAVVPDLFDFIYYALKNRSINHNNLATPYSMHILSRLGTKALDHYRRIVNEALAKSKRFTPPHSIETIAQGASRLISLGTQCGEGWLLAGEMETLIADGVSGIVCLQPFACLPNHVVGKGVVKPLRRRHPDANVVTLDYDPGASSVNQLNRIKLMMAVAHKKMAQA